MAMGLACRNTVVAVPPTVKDVWLSLRILTIPAMEACTIAKTKRRPRRPWPTKERVAIALELATAPGAGPDQSAAD